MSPAAVQPRSFASNRWQVDLVAAALLAGVVWMLYGRSLDAPFICDDTQSIVENESIRQLWPLWGDTDQPGPLRPAQDLPTCGRPLVNFSLALNHYFGGLQPYGYHLLNIAVHLLNVLLLAALVRRTLRLPYFAGRFDEAAGMLAFAAALLWAVHPLATEAVAYTTQRTELLVGFFYLATLYASLRYWQTAARGWLVLAWLACWAGMASKEVMVSAPLMVLLFDRTFLSASFRDAWQKSRLLYVGLFASWLLLLCLAGPGPRSASAGFHLDVPATHWWFTQARMLLMYLRLVVWPWPLSIHYELPYVTTFVEAWLYLVPVAMSAIVTLVLLWRRYAAGYVGALAFAILGPTLIVPVVTEIAAERRMYLPLAALLTLVVVGGYVAVRRFMDQRRANAIVVAAAVLLACIGGVTSYHRLAIYADELTIWQDVLAHHPDDATAYYNVGTIFLERDEPQTAAVDFERAISIRPDYARAHFNLGTALAALGRQQEATAHFQRALAIQPNYVLGYVKMGYTHLKAGRASEAIKQFRAALQLQPGSAAAHSGLAGALLADSQRDEAMSQARTALELAPNNADAHNALGAALAQSGQWDEAIEHFEAAVRLEPTLAQAQGNLMAAYASLGRNDEAITTANKALALARASGDTALEEQISAFLADFQSRRPDAPAHDVEHGQE